MCIFMHVLDVFLIVMEFKNFLEFRDFIRRYNSTSVLEIGSQKCWQNWPGKYIDPLDWLRDNVERNYAVRIMLLASAGNPHQNGDITLQKFNELINVYHEWGQHTISEKISLKEEVETLLSSIK